MYVKKCKKNSGICNIGAALKLSRFDRSKVTNIGQKLHARIAITRLERKNKLPKKTIACRTRFCGTSLYAKERLDWIIKKYVEQVGEFRN
jgi:hypothetical protein